MNKESLREFVILAQNEIARGALEDVLRHLFSAHLINIFPENPWWVQEHILGTETHVHFADGNGIARTGFADSVVGKTAIEYEKNLTIRAIFDEGYHQVKEYCASLLNLGIERDDIYGVLSDTVRWYGYSINIIGNNDGSRLYGADDIQLNQLDVIDLSIDTDAEISRFEYFTEKYFGRSSSRILTAKALALDFGAESVFYERTICDFQTIVNNAMINNPTYAELIKNVWQSFVAYLGASDFGEFSEDTYVNEFYLVTISKLICANVLNGSPMISDSRELQDILSGAYFKAKNILNLVDYDYFGWLNKSPYIENIEEFAKSVQQTLSYYDFNIILEEDLFGEILAQLSQKEHRLLLGQDFTPHWLAKEMVKSVIDSLDEEPRMLDMCCGSGVFLIETIKAVREKYNIAEEEYTEEKDNIIFSAVMGFDIDPLAVMLAKVNWVLAMRDLFAYHEGSITIPVYHADSLFAATPVSHRMPENEQESYRLHFDGHSVDIPAFLLTPRHRKTFDTFMSKCYSFAMIRAGRPESELSETQIESVVESVYCEAGVEQTTDELLAQRVSAYALVVQLERLQREGRNGIWYFLLNNSYRPGLVRNQFNCIISNPPWLAMSRLADNPYKAILYNKTERYGIKPPGSSHLHMELASTFLLSSIDKYLKEDARWMCIMPGSIMSGYHHEPFRRAHYISSVDAIETRIDEIWELPINTFKNKAIVLGGKRGSELTEYPVSGRIYSDRNTYQGCEYTLNIQGNRSAWTNRGSEEDVLNLINGEPWSFNQGADIMPRTILFHKFEQNPNNTWKMSRIEADSDLKYIINDSKMTTGSDIETDGVEDRFIFDCYISKHLSPFLVSRPAKIFMPAEKRYNLWECINDDDIALMNASTAYVFENIKSELAISLREYLEDKLNIRGKLYKQDFSLGRWLVLSNAGGANPCSAYIDLNEIDATKLIIDQTLYWYLADSEDEAIYITGMLNSDALSDLISDFQPDGGFGKRHIHTIPYKVIPRYEPDNPSHERVVVATERLISAWRNKCANNDIGLLVGPNSSTLSSRRRRQQVAIKELDEDGEYAEVCAAVLGL